MRRFADVGGSVYRRFFLEAPSACGTAVRAVAVFLRKQGAKALKNSDIFPR